MTNKIFIYIFYISIIKLSFSYLIFPFKTRQSQIKNIEKNKTLLLRSLIDNHIYINLEIGEPKQIIELFIRSNSHNFYLSEKPNNNTEIDNIDPYIINVNSDLNKFFDIYNSTTLEITNKSIYSSPGNIHLGNISNDYIYFTNNLNKKYKIKFPFILFLSTMGNMPGVIGLKAVIYEKQKEYNFIDKLKLNEVINSYFWMINYTSEYEGNLIIGEQPNIFAPLYYKENKLYFTYPFYDETIYDWGLKFNKIIFNEKNIIHVFLIMNIIIYKELKN